jgi:hypothetical protein
MGLCPVNTDCVNVTLPTAVSNYATNAAASSVLICSVLQVVTNVHAVVCGMAAASLLTNAGPVL